MSKNLYRFKGNFKSFLFILAILITFGFLYYTQTLVSRLEAQSRELSNLKARIFEESINKDDVVDISFLFSNIIQAADYPIIYTDSNHEPQFWRNLNIPPSGTRRVPQDTLNMVKAYLRDLESINPPIPITYQGSALGYYYYGESFVIRQLKMLPLIEIIVVGMFILIGYAGFNSIKKSEERFIWVGMAKETAHQLGTPLSSQIGWVEYLKSAPDQTTRVITELEKDIARLQTITSRFSQIGSRPEMKDENLFEIIGDTVQYFQNRIPHRSGKTQLRSKLDPEITHVMLNKDLFSWVLENLIKNGLDAMENKGGEILISSGPVNGKQLYIDVIDTGKGISKKDRTNIFKPGFSTKKRGWGLGLSLAKRIVEDYHGGKLLLMETQPGEGTTFRILLRTT